MRLSARSLLARVPSFMMATGFWEAVGSAKPTRSYFAEVDLPASAQTKGLRQTNANGCAASDEQFFFAFDRFVRGAWCAGASRPQEIKTYFDSGNDRRNSLHGFPDSTLELRAGFFHRF